MGPGDEDGLVYRLGTFIHGRGRTHFIKAYRIYFAVFETREADRPPYPEYAVWALGFWEHATRVEARMTRNALYRRHVQVEL